MDDQKLQSEDETTSTDERTYIRHRWLVEFGGQRDQCQISRYYFQTEHVLKVSAGWKHTVVLCSSHRVFVWGEQGAGSGELGLGDRPRIILKPMLQPTLTSQETAYRSIACGPKFSAAVTEDGLRVYFWGSMVDQTILVPTKFFEVSQPNFEVQQVSDVRVGNVN
jgi:alpha-tubulin suppressor-like RCC1 family protein